ncbi:MAG: hypothetical protein HY313_06165 [Acidobacteria bacterium]|nr:hypothetical protein [Acidobacteriota bacterium]
MKKNLILYGFLLVATILGGEYALTQGVGTVSQQPAVDLHTLKSQMVSFQSALNRSIQGSFEQPFALLQDAKGTYLPDFGVAFHLEVNLYPMRIITPFDMRPYTSDEMSKARTAKQERIRSLRKSLSALLLEQGEKLSALPPEQNVAVVVHLFNLPSEQSVDLPTQLVLETSLRSLLDSRAQRMTAEDFQSKVTFLAF